MWSDLEVTDVSPNYENGEPAVYAWDSAVSLADSKIWSRQGTKNLIHNGCRKKYLNKARYKQQSKLVAETSTNITANGQSFKEITEYVHTCIIKSKTA